MPWPHFLRFYVSSVLSCPLVDDRAHFCVLNCFSLCRGLLCRQVPDPLLPCISLYSHWEFCFILFVFCLLIPSNILFTDAICLFFIPHLLWTGETL